METAASLSTVPRDLCTVVGLDGMAGMTIAMLGATRATRTSNK